jgi:flagellar L-ring protein precursor FlgH
MIRIAPVAADPRSPALRLVYAAALLATAVLSPLMTGCATINPPPKVDLADTRPVQAIPTVQASPVNGSIFQMAQYRPLFEDHRARLVGDTLTINIVEKVTASQSSNSSVDRSGSLDGSVKALPLIKSNPLDRASISGTSSNTFEGKGATENTNDF